MRTREQAKEYAQQKYRSYSRVDSIKVAVSLSLLAKFQDEEYFKKIIDSFTKLARKIKSKSELDEKLKDKSLSYLEWLCMTVDGNSPHPYSPVVKLPVGETQAYFNKLYGENF